VPFTASLQPQVALQAWRKVQDWLAFGLRGLAFASHGGSGAGLAVGLTVLDRAFGGEGRGG